MTCEKVTEIKKTWLFVLTGLKIGGMESYLVNILETPQFKKHRTIIVYHKDYGNNFQDRLNNLNVKVIYCPGTAIGVMFCLRLIGIIKQHNIDVVCDFRNDFSFSSLLAAKFCGLSTRAALYRSSRRAFKPNFLKNVFVSTAHKLTSLLSTHVIANTGIVLDNFYPKRNKENKKYALVYNGVNVERFKPAPEADKLAIRRSLGIDKSKIIVGHVGRFHKAKNHETLIKSFSILLKNRVGLHLLIVGDGALRADIENLACSLNIADSVTLAGERADVHYMLNAMDIFFYPSIYEGLPNAVLEAMACGLPIVASNIQEILEIVPPSDYPLYNAPDDADGHANGLEMLLDNPDICRKIGRLNMKWVRERFTIEASAENLINTIIGDCV